MYETHFIQMKGKFGRSKFLPFRFTSAAATDDFKAVATPQTQWYKKYQTVFCVHLDTWTALNMTISRTPAFSKSLTSLLAKNHIAQSHIQHKAAGPYVTMKYGHEWNKPSAARDNWPTCYGQRSLDEQLPIWIAKWQVNSSFFLTIHRATWIKASSGTFYTAQRCWYFPCLYQILHHW